MEDSVRTKFRAVPYKLLTVGNKNDERELSRRSPDFRLTPPERKHALRETFTRKL